MYDEKKNRASKSWVKKIISLDRLLSFGAIFIITLPFLYILYKKSLNTVLFHILNIKYSEVESLSKIINNGKGSCLVTLPIKYVRRLGWTPGTEISYELKESSNGIFIRPARKNRTVRIRRTRRK